MWMIHIAISYYRALAQLSRGWPAEAHSDLLYPRALRNTIDPGDPFDTFRDCVMGGKKKPTPEGLLGGVVDEIDGDKELQTLLPSILSMALKCDQQRGSTLLYRGFAGIYQKFLMDGTDMFANLGHLMSFCDALEFAANPLIPTMSLWFQAIWHEELAKAVIERLASCRRATYWVENRPKKVDILNEVRRETCYLMQMYTMTGFFSRYKQGVLSDSYRQACEENCRVIVRYFSHRCETTAHKSLRRSSRRGKGKGSTGDMYLFNWIDVTSEVLECVSRLVTDEDDNKFLYEDEYATTEDGTSS